MREHQVGQDRSVKSTVCGRWKYPWTSGNIGVLCLLSQKMKKPVIAVLTLVALRDLAKPRALAPGRPQKCATAARKACLLKNPVARCKKAANLPALVAASS